MSDSKLTGSLSPSNTTTNGTVGEPSLIHLSPVQVSEMWPLLRQILLDGGEVPEMNEDELHRMMSHLLGSLLIEKSDCWLCRNIKGESVAVVITTIEDNPAFGFRFLNIQALSDIGMGIRDWLVVYQSLREYARAKGAIRGEAVTSSGELLRTMRRMGAVINNHMTFEV